MDKVFGHCSHGRNMVTCQECSKERWKGSLANLDSIKAERDALKAEIETANDKRDYYENLLNSALNDRDALKSENEKLRKTIDDYDRAILIVIDERDKLKKDLEEAVFRMRCNHEGCMVCMQLAPCGDRQFLSRFPGKP